MPFLDEDRLYENIEEKYKFAQGEARKAYSDVLDTICEMPSADAEEVRRGKWLPNMEWFDDDYSIEPHEERYRNGWKCSLCGRIELIKEPYCHCGALMDGKE